MKIEDYLLQKEIVISMQPAKKASLFRFAFFVSTLALFLTVCSSCSFFGIGSQNSTPTPSPTKAVPTVDPCTAHTSNPITLTMAYGSEKEAWINDVVADFNSRQLTACDGPITVKATPIGSGDSMQQILAGSLKPDIWSPAGHVWLNLLDAKWQQKYGTHIISTGGTDTPSLVNSPVVIAMWKSEAQALGWPNTPIGWAEIAKLSTQGWSAFGHPELQQRFGNFKFGHTRPDLSNSGLDGVIGEYYAGANEQHTLTLDDVNNGPTKEFVSNIESSIIYYGDNSGNNSTGFFATQMFCSGPTYLSAAVMYESLVVAGNEGKVVNANNKPCQLPEPVVAIYPKEGTFFSDHPFVIPQASWVTPSIKAAALVFRNFLLAPAQQQKALQYGFRPGILGISINSVINNTNGADSLQPQATLVVPPGNVIEQVLSSWENQRRKVDVMLILDRSGSMNDPIGGTSKIVAAKQGLAEFTNLLGDLDGLGLTTFSADITTLTNVSALGPKRQQVLSLINSITASGNTRLFDTIDQAYKTLANQSSHHIKVIVVLTDGVDDASQISKQQLLQDVSARGNDAGASIKVFTIAYGSGTDVDTATLTQIANASGGQEYAGTPQNIKQVYLDISQFF
jgi:Ca-activated chloride channel homolog